MPRVGVFTEFIRANRDIFTSVIEMYRRLGEIVEKYPPPSNPTEYKISFPNFVQKLKALYYRLMKVVDPKCTQHNFLSTRYRCVTKCFDYAIECVMSDCEPERSCSIEYYNLLCYTFERHFNHFLRDFTVAYKKHRLDLPLSLIVEYENRLDSGSDTD